MSYKSAVYPSGAGGVAAGSVERGAAGEKREASVVDEGFSRVGREATALSNVIEELEKRLTVVSRDDDEPDKPNPEAEATGCQVVRLLEKHANGLVRMRQRLERMRRLLEI